MIEIQSVENKKNIQQGKHGIISKEQLKNKVGSKKGAWGVII